MITDVFIVWGDCRDVKDFQKVAKGKENEL